MTYREQVFVLFHRGMLAMWLIFLIIVGGLLVWIYNTGLIPELLPIDGWTMLRFVPVMMGFVTLMSCLQFLGLGSITLYFNIRLMLIVGVCYAAFLATRQYITGVWIHLPYVILVAEVLLLVWFAEKIDQDKLISRMVMRLPENSMSKFKLAVWPAMKIQNYGIWLMFSALGGILLFLFHEGWPTFVDEALNSVIGAILWWSLTVIGVVSLWHWVLLWIYNISQAIFGFFRGVLYVLFVALLLSGLYGLGFKLDALLISAPLALMSIIFSGELESMRVWNKTHTSV